MKGVCIVCSELKDRRSDKYCSNFCQGILRYQENIKKWKQGIITGLRGKTLLVSEYVKKYLREKYGNKCCKCGWDKVNSKTGKVPLEVNHIDRNAENNKEENLELICPNCHSLTENFRNLNKGKGRKGR